MMRKNPGKKRPRLAYFTPLSPVPSGISHYSEELLPHLSKTFDIDIYIDDYKPANKWITENLAVYNYLRFDSNLPARKYDQVIYHLGNNIYHSYMYPFIYRYPGILVLHDYLLHHSRAKVLLGKASEKVYKNEMIYAYKDSGKFIADLVIRGRHKSETFINHLPLNEKVVTKSTGVIVHNNYVKEQLTTKFKGKDIEVIKMGISVPERLRDPAGEKEKLGFKKDEIIFTSLGHISPNKKFDLIFAALKKVSGKIPDFKYILIGPSPEPHDIKKHIPHKITKKVIFTGYLPEDKLDSYLNASDLFINLREPYTRETSASMLRCFSYARPTIISHLVHNFEIPEDICYKVPFCEKETGEIAKRIIEFCKNREVGRSMGRKARKFVFENHHIERSSAHYRDYLLSHLRQSPLRSKKSYLNKKTLDRIIATPLSMLESDDSEQSQGSDEYSKANREYLEDMMKDLGVVTEPTSRNAKPH